MPSERLQKVLANAGVAARRKAEAIILEGHVTVNGKVVRELGVKADIETDRIELDGQRVEAVKTSTYIVLWKPARVVTTLQDEFNRRTVADVVRGVTARIYPVGRLDYDADGVLLMTDDGATAAALTHPGGGVPKIYRAKIRGRPGEGALESLRAGIELEDGLAAVIDIRVVETGNHASRGHSVVELTVVEGRNHLVKRLLEAVGHPVVALRRIRFGPLDLEGLKPGGWRHLRKDEVGRLRAFASAARKKRKAGKPMP